MKAYLKGAHYVDETHNVILKRLVSNENHLSVCYLANLVSISPDEVQIVIYFSDKLCPKNVNLMQSRMLREVT